MAAIARDWADGNTRVERKESKHRFRFIVPRPIPFSLIPESGEPGLRSDEASLRTNLLSKPDGLAEDFSDWWTIDLLPEGVFLDAIDDRKFPNGAPPDPQKSREPGSQWFSVDLEASGAEKNDEIASPQITSRENVIESIRKLRQEFRKKLLVPRAAAYIVERSEWLVVARTSAKACNQQDSDEVFRAIDWRRNSEEIPARFTSLPGERSSLVDFLPSLSEAKAPAADHLAGVLKEGVDIDFENRLVVINL
jgi:hypothetical protein